MSVGYEHNAALHNFVCRKKNVFHRTVMMEIVVIGPTGAHGQCAHKTVDQEKKLQ